MRNPAALLLGLAILSGAVWTVAAQESAGDQEDMRFINALRQRGDNDLARAYLERLKKNPSPGLVAELPLELAMTRLAEAADEPDTAKRMAMYLEARQEFEQFLARNPKHPRAGDAKLELAQVAVMQGKAQLAKAHTEESKEGFEAEGAKARIALADAGKRLKDATKELDLASDGLAEPKTPAEKEQRRKMEEDRQRAHLSIALNLYDQAMTYPTEGTPPKAYYDLLKDAENQLGKIAGGDANSASTWTAKAWQGRCLQARGETKLARGKLLEVLESTRSAATNESHRLARYFRMLVLKEDTGFSPQEKANTMTDIAERWIKEYPRSKNTPEGNGVRYELALLHLEKAGGLKPEQKQLRDLEFNKARALLREVELTDNEFTARARRTKLRVMKQQGAFDNKIETLKTFEDCYVRAQYEMSLITEETKDKPAEVAEKIKAARVDNILASLKRGLSLPEARGKRNQEIGNAQTIQAFYCLNTKRYREAIDVGEKFAREDTVSAQAATVATYALQAYSESIADRQRKAETTTGELIDEDGKKVDLESFQRKLKADRDKMVSFARHMQKCWPKETAGDLARHQLGLLLLHDKVEGDQDAMEKGKVKNVQEAIKTLGGISRNYPAHVFAMYILAESAFEADKVKMPLVPDDGKPAVPYRQQAIQALESMADPASGDPQPNLIFYLGKCRLGEEYYKDKKYEEMVKLVEPLLPKIKVPALRLSDDDGKNKEYKDGTEKRLVSILLFAKYGQAEAAFSAGKLADVAAMLDPLVDTIKADPNHPIKANVQLGQAVLGMALRANIQLGKLDRTEVVVQALQQISGDEGGDGQVKILRQLIALLVKQLEELHAKKDAAALAKAKEGFIKILESVSSKAKLTPEFIGSLAEAYSRLDMHAKSIELLNKMPKPKDADGERAYRPIQLMLVRQYRLNKEPKKARPIMDEVIGTKAKPGWGLRSVEPLKENIMLLADEEKYAQGFTEASKLAKQMLPKVDTDPAMKGHYLDCYYEMIYCMLKFGQHAKDDEKKEKTIGDAAKLIDQLEKKYADFGNEAMAKKVKDLLKKEPELAEALKKIKSQAAAG